jgi:flavin-dependent dehydrogenase
VSRPGAAVDVAVVGGGPAGATVAALLAAAGRSVVLLERAPAWRWRACGVFASPAAGAALRAAGLSETELAAVARPIPAMRVETARGTRVRLTYGAAGSGAAAAGTTSALGFDRQALDEALLQRARFAGVDVRQGTAVTSVELPGRGTHDGPGVVLRLAGHGTDEAPPLTARIVVGADGIRSIVARSAGVDRPSPLGRRVGLTFHVTDPWGGAAHDARMVVIADGYVGLAPVPGGRLNVGIVLGRRWASALRDEGAAPLAARILAALPADDGRHLSSEPLDANEGASPLGHRVSRRSGEGWLLVGDAAGFLDPFTGEGLHRAVVSAQLGAAAVDAALGRGEAGTASGGLDAYDRAMRGRFATKDAVSRLVQVFLGRPALFEYAARRLAEREEVRRTLGLVIGDLLPARRALDPRFLGGLLAP